MILILFLFIFFFQLNIKYNKIFLLFKKKWKFGIFLFINFNITLQIRIIWGFLFRSVSGIPRPSFPLITSDTHRYSLTYTPHAPLTHPHTHSLTHTLTHSPTHSLTHTLTHTHLHTTMCTAKGSDVGPCICFSFEWLFLKYCWVRSFSQQPCGLFHWDPLGWISDHTWHYC